MACCRDSCTFYCTTTTITTTTDDDGDDDDDDDDDNFNIFTFASNKKFLTSSDLSLYAYEHDPSSHLKI
jgi:hypothetical protein